MSNEPPNAAPLPTTDAPSPNGTPSGSEPAGHHTADEPADVISEARRPDALPAKFWNEETGEVRTEALVKSYIALEQKLGGEGGVPERPDDYRIETESLFATPTAEINEELHAAGFTQDQAQLVYSLAEKYVEPLMADVASEFRNQQVIEKLESDFGGPERWQEVRAQLKTWAESKLAPETAEAMSRSYEGIKALYDMMTSREPGFINDGRSSHGASTESGLKELMRDPRYWRDHDPALVQHVQDGFARLYPGKG